MLKLVAWVAALGLGSLMLAQSASGDEPPAHKRRHVRAAGPAEIYCGCCGCLGVTFDYHRELRSTYGLKFDPRNFDQTEPYYYFGRVRAYPRYWIDPGPPAAKYP
jgi:hypothetical protein